VGSKEGGLLAWGVGTQLFAVLICELVPDLHDMFGHQPELSPDQPKKSILP
jgi:hypothetical protein